MTSLEWRRNSFARPTFNSFDAFELTTLTPGETVVRTIMGWNANVVAASSTGSPSSAAITKVGLILFTPSTPPSGLPTPISQPNADWISLATVPWRSSLAESTNIVWSCNASIDAHGENSQGQRHVPAGPNLSLYISWESLFAVDTNPAFVFAPVGTVDALIRIP